MSLLDIFLGGLLAYGLIKGIRNGIFIEITSVYSLIIGIYLAVKFSFQLQSFVSEYLHSSQKTIQITAFILTFILVVIGISFLAKVLTKIADFAFLGWVNRLLGGIFGLIRMTLLLGVCFNILSKISTEIIGKETQEKSFFYKPIIESSKIILPVLEKSFEDFKKETTSVL